METSLSLFPVRLSSPPFLGRTSEVDTGHQDLRTRPLVESDTKQTGVDWTQGSVDSGPDGTRTQSREGRVPFTSGPRLGLGSVWGRTVLASRWTIPDPVCRFRPFCSSDGPGTTPVSDGVERRGTYKGPAYTHRSNPFPRDTPVALTDETLATPYDPNRTRGDGSLTVK